MSAGEEDLAKTLLDEPVGPRIRYTSEGVRLDWDEEAHPRVPAGQAGGGQFGAGGGHALERRGTEFGRVNEPPPTATPAPTPSASMRAKYEAARARASAPGLTREHFASVDTDTARIRGEIHERMRSLEESRASGDVPEEGYKPVREQLEKELKAVVEPKFTPEEIVGGIKHPGLREWMSKDENKPHLELVTTFATPLQQAMGVESPTAGQYQSFPNMPQVRGNIRIDANHYATKPPADPKRPGDTWAASGLDTGKTYANGAPVRHSGLQETQSNFLHELGHHVHMLDMAHAEDPIKGPEFVIVDKTIQRAYDTHGFDREGSVGVPYRDRVLMGMADSNPAISRYAATNHKEYFAESFEAYLEHPDILKAHDPTGFDMVNRVLHIRGIKQDD